MKFPSKKEKDKLKQGYSIIVGCDEVGRGSLAGPVVAAAVVWKFPMLRKSAPWEKEVNDSKLLSPLKRSELSVFITDSCHGYGIGKIEPKVIDEVNIHHAILRAMHIAITTAVGKVSSETSDRIVVLVDGKFIVPGLPWEQEAIVNGDANVFSISAASIVAKVYRDSFMVKLHKMFPSYGFARHKGYGTEQHFAAVRKWGMSPVHRVSFCGNIV
jgi:ribonuclease HII